jgi:hypothetical protein
MKPIAWYDPSNGMVSTDQDCPLFTPLGQVWGLYPKQEWVGLTDEDEIDWEEGGNLKDLVKAIEAKLKAKNT